MSGFLTGRNHWIVASFLLVVGAFIGGLLLGKAIERTPNFTTIPPITAVKGLTFKDLPLDDRALNAARKAWQFHCSKVPKNKQNPAHYQAEVQFRRTAITVYISGSEKVMRDYYQKNKRNGRFVVQLDGFENELVISGQYAVEPGGNVYGYRYGFPGE